MIKTKKIGSIDKSRVYIGLEIRPTKSDRIRLFRGPTYHGTTHAFIFTAGRFSLMAHTRQKDKKYAK